MSFICDENKIRNQYRNIENEQICGNKHLTHKWVKEEIDKEIRNYLGMNENKRQYLEGRFIAIRAMLSVWNHLK